MSRRNLITWVTITAAGVKEETKAKISSRKGNFIPTGAAESGEQKRLRRYNASNFQQDF